MAPSPPLPPLSLGSHPRPIFPTHHPRFPQDIVPESRVFRPRARFFRGGRNVRESLECDLLGVSEGGDTAFGFDDAADVETGER